MRETSYTSSFAHDFEVLPLTISNRFEFQVSSTKFTSYADLLKNKKITKPEFLNNFISNIVCYEISNNQERSFKHS